MILCQLLFYCMTTFLLQMKLFTEMFALSKEKQLNIMDVRWGSILDDFFMI